MKTISRIAGLMVPCLIFLQAAPARAGQARLTRPHVSAVEFNPHRGDHVDFSFELSKPSRVTLRVLDMGGAVVRTLASNARLDSGPHHWTWDGRDDRGAIVPDEAYVMQVQGPSGPLWDPCASTGGDSADIREASFLPDRALQYRLPVPARVLVRFGIHGGPMHRTLVDWEPRPAGVISEPWDGRDESSALSLRSIEGFATLITYVSLPEATVIAVGNDRVSFEAYRKAHPAPSGAHACRNQPAPGLRSPHVTLELLETPNEAEPHVSGTVDVRVDAASADRDALAADQFEVMFFVDEQFVAEAERGYLPLRWRWELQQLPPGDHTLTVNVSSLGGQVGTASRRVHTQPEKP